MSTRTRLLIDAGLFFAFVAASNPAVTGIAVHEWLCLIAIAPVMWHLIINWDWVARTAVRFADKIRATSRLNLLVDALLFVATVAVMVSGFAVSRSILAVAGIEPSSAAIWHSLHAFSADAVFALFAAHTVLHWRWILNAVRGLVRQIDAAPPVRPASPAPAHPAVNPARMSAPPAPPVPNHFM